MKKNLIQVLNDLPESDVQYRKLSPDDAPALFDFIQAQKPDDFQYFNPHPFDRASIKKQLKKHGFLMMGSFHDDRLIGYFFLRFFVNKTCFVGRIIDRNYRGKGVGRVMNDIMYKTAWAMNFRCLSTISRKNQSIMRAHAKNNRMVVRKELPNDYILVEFMNRS